MHIQYPDILMISGAYQRRVTRKGVKWEALTIHPETAQRICTTALAKGANLEDAQRTAGHADPSRTQLDDKRCSVGEVGDVVSGLQKE